MNEKFIRKVLKFVFGCMDLGTQEDAAKLTKSQQNIRTYMLGDPVVVDMQQRLVAVAKASVRHVFSSDMQQRLVRPGTMPVSSTDVAPPPQPPYPPQPDLLPAILGPSFPVDHRKHVDETSSDEDSRL